MRASIGRLRGLVRDMWLGRRTPASAILALATTPLASLFAWGVRLRGLGFDLGVLKATKAPIPVVSVGNLAVGGTGKTPVSRWLAEALVEVGWRPALVVRGYGEDEVRLHREWNPKIPVIVSPRRIEGVREAAREGCTVAVLDDGFQHRALARDLDIVLLAASHIPPFRILPRGPFREPPRALDRADHVLVTAKGANERAAARRLAAHVRGVAGRAPVHILPLLPMGWRGWDGEPADPPSGPPLVVCSIAEPGGFLSLVEERLARPDLRDLELLAFPDHHPYAEGECRELAARAGERWIATTEKDAVKLVQWREILPDVRVLPLEVRPEPNLAEALLAPLGPPSAPGGS